MSIGPLHQELREEKEKETCGTCGVEVERKELTACQFCGATKCSFCDLGEGLCAYCDFPDEGEGDF